MAWYSGQPVGFKHQLFMEMRWLLRFKHSDRFPHPVRSLLGTMDTNVSEEISNLTILSFEISVLNEIYLKKKTKIIIIYFISAFATINANGEVQAVSNPGIGDAYITLGHCNISETPSHVQLARQECMSKE